MKWKPIETAPEETNAVVDLWCDDGLGKWRATDCCRRIFGDGWKDDCGNIISEDSAKFWMYAPDPPDDPA